MINKDEIVRHKILIEAQKLFQQYGLRKTTMDEIATACGKAKSTLYHYFKSKPEVFDAVIEMELLDLRKHVKSRVEEHRNTLDKIKAYAREFHQEALNKKNLYRIIREEYRAKTDVRRHFLSVANFEQNYIIRILEDGYDLKELREMKKEDIPWAAEMFLAAFLGIVLYTVEKDGFLDEEKLGKAIGLIVPKIFD